ncbi:MAG: AMP-binding protein [Bacilli bacterium]
MFLYKLDRKLKSYSKWNKYYTKEERKLKVKDETIYDYFYRYANTHLKDSALNYYNKKFTYEYMLKNIDKLAVSLTELGVNKMDIITLILPNIPEAIILFYAINKIGAVSNMVHPLSSEDEMKNILINNESKIIITIDAAYDKLKDITLGTNIEKIIGISASRSLPLVLKTLYNIKTFGKNKKPIKKIFSKYNILVKNNGNYFYKKNYNVKEKPACILQSGGTTGTSKGIVLSNSNFNSFTIEAQIMLKKLKPKDKVLAILPIFHGFGLAFSINSMLCLGVEVILIPAFKSIDFSKILIKYKPQMIFGVPTLYESLLQTKDIDLSYLKYAVCGGDSLSENLELNINEFFLKHNANIKISQGYGMTECLAGAIANFDFHDKIGSIGIPGPGNDVKIVKPHTQNEVSNNTPGEICISGPTIMLGYLNNEKETNMALQKHKDGYTWLHTGDIGYIDNDGLIYFKQRLKRMIISSGYNVYPSHVENIICSHEAVLTCIVIGISHPYKVEVPKAIIVLKNTYIDNPILRMNIKNYVEKKLAKFEWPYKYEFRKSLPKTKMGKIDFKKLQNENK